MRTPGARLAAVATRVLAARGERPASHLARRMRRGVCHGLLGAVLLLPALAGGQQAGDLEAAGGMTLAGDLGLADRAGATWLVGAGWYATPWLALVAELDRGTLTRDAGGLAVETRLFGLLGGVRVGTAAGPVRPIAQLLAGQTQIELHLRSGPPFPGAGSYFERRWSLQTGGGAELPIADRVAIRFTLDWRRIFAPVPLWQRRFTGAAVYRLPRW